MSDIEPVIKSYTGKSVLITGARGYLGSALTARLATVDCQLLLWDRPGGDAWLPADPIANIERFAGDVSTPDAWREMVPQVDTVFHLAAFEHHHGSPDDAVRDLEVNALAVLHLVEACRECESPPKVIFASSSNLFGRAKSLPVNEDAPDDPLTLFAIHKLAAERYLSLAAVADEIQAVSLRLANVYGPTPHRSRMQQVVLNKLIARALEQQALSLFENRDCRRDYVFIDDAVAAFLLAGKTKELCDGSCYVIGSEQGHAIEEVVRMVATESDRRTGGETRIDIDTSVSLGPAERREFIADCGRFRAATGWKAETTLEAGIQRTIDAIQQTP